MKKLFNLKNDYVIRLWLCSLIFVLLGIGGLWLSSVLQEGIPKNIIGIIAPTLIISGVYNVIYEYVLRTELLDLIIKKVGLKSSISKQQVLEIGNDFNEIDFRRYIITANERIDIVHTYAETWTRNYIDSFEELICKRKIEIRIGMLAPTSEFCTSIAKHYGKTHSDMTKKILKTRRMWESISNLPNKKGSVSIYPFDGNPVHSIYRFDDTIIMVSNKITNKLDKSLPYIICEKGTEHGQLTLFNSYMSEMDAIFDNAEPNQLRID